MDNGIIIIKATLRDQQRQLEILAAAGIITKEQRQAKRLINEYLTKYGRITD